MTLRIAPGERRAMVHIGLSKTGSLTIQTWLAQNRDALAQQGVTFDPLDTGTGPTPFRHVVGFGCLAVAVGGREIKSPHIRAFHGLTDTASWTARAGEFRTRAEASIAGTGPGTYVISSEWLADVVNTTENIAALDAWLAKRFDRVQYLVYLRDQRDWVVSAYGQHVKTGGTSGMAQFVARRCKQDYNAVVQRWLAVVGRDRLAVRLLIPEFLTGGDLIADCASLIGVDTAPLTLPGRMNESMSKARLTALLLTNRAAALLPAAVVQRLRGVVLMRRNQDTGPKLKLTPAQSALITDSNATSNETLRALLFPERKVLFR